MARIYRHGAYYWVDYKDSEGKRHRETTKAQELVKAQYIGGCKANGIVDGIGVSRAITWADLVKAWNREKCDKVSYRDDKQRLAYLSLYFPEPSYIHTITAEDMQQIKEDLKTKKIHKKTIGNATVNRYLVLMRCLFNYAKSLNYPHNNPMEGIGLLAEHPRNRIATDQEYATLRDNANGELRKAIVLAYHTGMRQGEIYGLGVENIIITGNPYILLSANQCKNGEGRLIPVELNSEVYQIIKQFQPFTIRKDHITKGFKRLCKRVGITGLRFHDLRRTFATRLRRGGVDILTAAKLTGHKTLAILQRHYSIVESDDLRQAIQKIS